MLDGLSPSVERKRPNNFTVNESEGISIEAMQEMFNNKQEPNAASPCSIKLSNKEGVADAFRVSMLIYDMWMTDEINGAGGNLDIFDKNRMLEDNIFLDDIFETMFEETNLLLTHKDINWYAESKDDLKGLNQILLDRQTNDREINSEEEEKFKLTQKHRMEAKKAETQRLEETKGKILSRKTPKHYHITMTPDATLYYGSLVNQKIIDNINDLHRYTDEYIAMTNNTIILNKQQEDLNLSYKSKTWVDHLNIAAYKHFITKSSGLGNKNAGDDLRLRKYDAYELLIYRDLNKILKYKLLEKRVIKKNKKSIEQGELGGEKVKKSLLLHL